MKRQGMGEGPDGQGRAPFETALERALARRGVSLDCFSSGGDKVSRRMLVEYGAMFVAEGVLLPPVCLFEDDEQVESFQREAGWRGEVMGGARVELQPAAMAALVRARADAAEAGL
ncbi:MAG TPA: hypothetical protein VN228_09425, partial [Pyrinomonadaceae bacterium]|nr:hypothetical protein [Pyrinomonadaceae bacterium]